MKRRQVPQFGVSALLLVVLAVVVTSCGPATLETEDLESLQASLTTLREPLAPEERASFDESLRYLVGGAEPGNAANPKLEKLVLDIYRPLTGYTVEQIIAEAYIKRVEQVKTAIAELAANKPEDDENRELLSKFTIVDSRVYKINKGFLEWPMLQLRVENNTGQTISMVRFRAVLLSPDDPDPWLTEDLDYLIYEGMSPGARDMWRIEPELQDWIQLVDPHPDLIFAVEVTGLYAIGNRVIAEIQWGATEEHRLELYRKTLSAIRETKSLELDSPPTALTDTT